LLGYTGSTLTTDVKGELATITATRRVALGQNVFVADPFDTVKGPARKHRARFNPMSVLKPGSPTLIEDAGLIADAVVVPGNTQAPRRVGYDIDYAFRDTWEVWCEAGLDVVLVAAVSHEDDARAIVRQLTEEYLFVTRGDAPETFAPKRTEPA
jgi:hypothetical protein